MSQKIFITSDTHFFHARAIKLCNRPFSDMKQMNDHMLDRINTLVGPGDILFHLGDLCFRDNTRPEVSHMKCCAEILSQIRCNNIHFVVGNHDPITKSGQPKQEFADMVYSCRTMDTFKFPIGENMNSKRVRAVLCHYALLSLPGNPYHLFGHSHGNLGHPNPKALDVGVDCWNYEPITFNQILERIKQREEAHDNLQQS